MSQTTLDLNADSDSDSDSDKEIVDSQATIIDENPPFNPIRLIDCATLVESGRDILRRTGIFEYQGKGITAFYQSSGTSGSPLLKGTYLPFYGETNKLLKANDINADTQSKAWKLALRPICKFSHKILNYFEDFYELQISASIDSPFWDGTCYRDFVLSHDFNEITGEFVLLPNQIPSSNNFSEMDCARHIEIETGQINDFLRSSGARIGKRQIEVYQQQRQEAERLAEMYALQQQQQQEEDIKEPPGSLKLDKGGKNLKKQKKTKKSKKTNKKMKSNKKRKTRKQGISIKYK